MRKTREKPLTSKHACRKRQTPTSLGDKQLVTVAIHMSSFTHLDEICSKFRVSLKILREVPVCGRQTREGQHQREKDAEETDIGAQGSNQIDEAENAHKHLEETCGLLSLSDQSLEYEHLSERKTPTKASIEALRLQSSRSCLAIGRKRREGRETRTQRSSKGEPEGAEAQEDDRRKAVTENPFEDTSQDHEEATEEEVRRSVVGVVGYNQHVSALA